MPIQEAKEKLVAAFEEFVAAVVAEVEKTPQETEKKAPAKKKPAKKAPTKKASAKKAKITRNEVKEAATAYLTEEGADMTERRATLIQLLKKYGATNVATLKDEDLEDFYDAIRAR
jgi:hypothetical protein